MEKKKILMFCEAGMSTSIMVKKMMEVANEHNMPVEIEAHPMARAAELVEKEKPILILLGPQVKFMESKMHKMFDDKGIPIDVVDSSAYAQMDGETVMKDALRALKASKNK